MVFNIFTPGTKAKAEEVNENFTNIMYSVLMNRMENDLTGQEQIDTSIVSDNFNCACGRYNTVCTAGTTSSFNSNLYTNCVYSLYIFPGYVSCCYFTMGGSSIHSVNCGSNCITSTVCGCATGVACYVVSSCDNLPLNCYKSIAIQVCSIVCTTGYVCYSWNSITGADFPSFSVCHQAYNAENSACYCYVYSGGGSMCSNCKFVNTCINYCYSGGNYYCVYFNGTGINCICGTNNLSFSLFRCVNMTSFVCGTGCNTGLVCLNIIYYSLQNSIINTNLKNYATPRNAVMLVTNSVLPAGNSIAYDIKNQAGCTYVCNALPNTVYNLCAADSCCFYAVIKQNVVCNLCEPQCMFGYALKMM